MTSRSPLCEIRAYQRLIRAKSNLTEAKVKRKKKKNITWKVALEIKWVWECLEAESGCQKLNKLSRNPKKGQGKPIS